jgi:hypothetical protein
MTEGAAYQDHQAGGKLHLRFHSSMK